MTPATPPTKDDNDGGRPVTVSEGTFYAITDDEGLGEYTLLDKTKRGLEVRERSVDDKAGVMADKGMIHGMDGIGHLVPIRWHYDKRDSDISDVTSHAESIERRYTELREITCPDD